MIIKPQDGGQTNFLSRSEYEVLFGGSAGPGKSWGLVIDALGLQFKASPLGCAAIEVSDYRGVLFRRKTTQLSKLIDEGKKYYRDFGAEFVSHRRGDPGPSFNFPSGARIFCCHLEQEDNKEDHQGIEYQYVGFDELTQFTLTQYLYLFSRLRSTTQHLSPRIRSTTNPTGAGLIWVKKRFYKDLEPYKAHYFIANPDDAGDPRGVIVDEAHKDGRSRVFVPGKLSENQILISADPHYESNIKAMGKTYERALLHGDWDAFSGDFFKDFSKSDMVIPPFKIDPTWKLIGSLDPGYSSPCSFSMRAKDFEGNIYRIGTYYEKEKSPTQHAEAIKAFITSNPFTDGRMPEFVVSGLDAWAKKDRYAILASDLTFNDIMMNQGIYLTQAVTDRKQGWWAMKDLMKQGKYFVFDTYNEPFLDEITAVEADEKDPEDIKGRGNDPNVSDHALDEDRYGNMSLYSPQPYTPVAKIPERQQYFEEEFESKSLSDF